MEEEGHILDLTKEACKPNIDFKKLAIKFSIDWYLACGKIPYYGHHLFDYLIAKKIIEVTVEDKTRVYNEQKELEFEQLKKDRWVYDQYGETCFVYQMEQVENNKSDKVINASKVKLLVECIAKKEIDFKQILAGL